jgi:pimeloyl-ACP methyl ester carboxylesterase
MRRGAMQLDEWQRGARTFDYHGHAIFYRDQGPAAAPVLICIHGFPTASWDWHKLWPALSARFRVIAADMIGFGLSAKPHDYDYSLGDQATLHELLIATLDIATAHVLAHDYGDSVAQELLARHNERAVHGTPGLAIRSMCFLNGGLFPERHRARLIQKLLHSPLGPLLARLNTERAFRASFTPIFGPHTRPSEAELATCWQLIAHNDGARIAHRLIRYIAERRSQRDRWVGALQQTQVPLRFINGPEDPVSGRHMAERYRELVPNPDVVLLEGIGHYPQLEAPDRVLEAYLEFIQSNEQ